MYLYIRFFLYINELIHYMNQLVELIYYMNQLIEFAQFPEF